MKVAVYAVEYKGVWCLRVSLDLKIDLNWWKGTRYEETTDNRSRTKKIIILSYSMPLGWASKLREGFTDQMEMQQWGTKAWDDYVREILREEWIAEKEERSRCIKGDLIAEMDKRNGCVGNAKCSEVEVEKAGYEDRGMPSLNRRGSEMELEAEADTLAEMMSGRSLLESELIALLGERCPELLGHWRSVAQLAHLKGRLKLEAAVIPETMHAADKREKKSQQRNKAGFLALPAVAALLLHGRRFWRGAARRRALPRCQRCGSAATARTACAACGLAGCAYCEACLALGRSRACALLLRGAALPATLQRSRVVPDPTAAAGRWGLGPAQAEAAGAALAFLAEPRKRSAVLSPERFLLWAVTGAGKTEMTFPLLSYVLDSGGKVLVATPRRDVVLELAPRIAAAFPAVQSAVLYGGSPQRWEEARLVLSTTHQLLRFHQAFDLVIIDEMDAFPYHNDPMLAFAAESACRLGGKFIFLSATPPTAMQREIRTGRLPHAKVPVRYHGHPLPVPHRLEMKRLEVCLSRRLLPVSFIRSLEESIRRGAQIFVFVSRIRFIEPLVVLLRRQFPRLSIQGTSSQDEGRGDKIVAFRSGDIRLLVTTTILERGVTVPRSDVYIMDADCNLFDESSLVQMAGRAGRSKDDPAGAVLFTSPEWTTSQRSAIRQIQRMNTIAHREGYLHKIQGEHQ